MGRAPWDGRKIIPTESSRPHHHPNELSKEMVWRILELRKERNQCAEILRHRLKKGGLSVSLSSVKRVLQRFEMTRFSRWKKWHQYPERPMPEKPGFLVEIDTIHDGDLRERMGLYTLLDVCSRWAHALPTIGMNTRKSLRFVERAKIIAPFEFKTIQSDHGSEFSLWFTKRILEGGMSHRHSRIRTPNDNAHLERFNRTIQEECIARIPRNIIVWRKEIPEYLRYYNTQRPHMGLGMKTPADIIKAVQSY
jgi:transposase InsO family protein